MLVKKRISVFYFLNLIKWDLLAIFIYSTIIGTLDHYLIFRDISIPISVSALVGTLLSLLLAFRTSQSYERWWEARTVWGAIVNDSRTFIRQLIAFIPASAQKTALLVEFANRQSVWCFALSQSLRRLPFSRDVQQYLDVHDLKGENVPNMLLNQHASRLAAIGEELSLNPNKIVQLDATLQRLTDAMGKCERIKGTVFPRSYSMLIHFLIYSLMTLLPFGLDDNRAVVEICLVFFIPALFIAIEQTAILMQDPFENKPNDTAMTNISQKIERNLKEMVGEPLPAPIPEPDNFYIL
ncbi:MAG: hypothetical protein EOO02_22885 [Chitinophagaceae bacterium]|nr:MAG: hypothetical protein EOO02_22885 [Chitinophagaceae bacterium]